MRNRPYHEAGAHVRRWLYIQNRDRDLPAPKPERKPWCDLIPTPILVGLYALLGLMAGILYLGISAMIAVLRNGG